MRKSRRAMVAFLSILLVIQPVPINALADSGDCVILMDAGSGRILYERNAHQPRTIASITKLMTALVALESGHDLSEIVTIKPEWAGVEGSSIYLRAGEEIQLKTLLYGLMLQSGNDAALAVAGYCGKSIDGFVQKMNEMAAQLGMENSHFENPSGLTQEGHYSTAYDMALLAQACLNHEVLSEIVATKTITLEERAFRNHNKLLWQYDGCIGLKTGYTEKAGRTLVSAAKKNGLTLICVTLNAPNDWKDHKELFDYGFTNYQGRSPYKKGDVIGALPVSGSLIPVCPIEVAETTVLALKEEEEIEIQIQLEHGKLRAPLSAGTKVGTILYSLAGRELLSCSLVTAKDIPGNRVENLKPWENVMDRLKKMIG